MRDAPSTRSGHVWGRDNRGAMLRVAGECGDPSTRIENRLGEPAANPYLYLASQIHAGLDGIARKLRAPRAPNDPYNADARRLPTTLAEALDALGQDDVFTEGLGREFTAYYLQVKRADVRRFDEAEDKDALQRREYFARY